MREVGAEIRRLREGQGWTGAQLAVYAGMAPSAVSQIETGKRSPNTGSLAKIARALEVEVGDLFPKAEAQLPLDFRENGGTAGARDEGFESPSRPVLLPAPQGHQGEAPYDDPRYSEAADLVTAAMFELADRDKVAFHLAVESDAGREYFLQHESDVMGRLMGLPKAELAEACIALAKEYVILAHDAAMSRQGPDTADEVLGPEEHNEWVRRVAQEAVDQAVAASSGRYAKSSAGVPRIKVTSGRKGGPIKVPRKTTRKKRAKEQ